MANLVDETFVKAHTPWMLALARRILHEPQLAEDAVQEALLLAHTRQSGFRGDADVKTWLYKITVNAALAILRSQPNLADIESLQPVFDLDACRIETPWGALPTLEALFEDAETAVFVRQCIEQLPEDFQICLALRDIEQLSVREVANTLGITEANVKVRTHRARSALKVLLEPLLRGQSVREITGQPLPPTLRPSIGRTLKAAMLKYFPMMITCVQFEQFIGDYVDGVLPARERRIFEFHVRMCRECREYLAAYEHTRAMARWRSASR